MSSTGTEALYYSDPTLDRAEATILEVLEGGRGLILDRSLFYPEGGGQPCDLGSIEGAALEWVGDTGGRQLHRLREPLALAPGARVGLSLDRPRRVDHTEQHSAQHLLSGLLFRGHGIPTLSFHLGSELSTIDVDAADFPPSLAEELEAEVNEAIGRGLAFVLHRSPPEELSTLPLRRLPPPGEEVLRIWEIRDLDWSPCCGTHVTSSAELRLFLLHQAERYKGKTRLHFSAGGRALAYLRRLRRSAREAGRILSAPLEALDAGAERLARSARESSRRAEELLELYVARSLELSASLPPPPVLDLGEAGPPALEAGLRALRSRGLPGILRAGETALVLAPPGAELPPALAEAARALGGRGGGARGLYRASFPEAEAASRFAEGARELLAGLLAAR